MPFTFLSPPAAHVKTFSLQSLSDSLQTSLSDPSLYVGGDNVGEGFDTPPGPITVNFSCNILQWCRSIESTDNIVLQTPLPFRHLFMSGRSSRLNSPIVPTFPALALSFYRARCLTLHAFNTANHHVYRIT